MRSLVKLLAGLRVQQISTPFSLAQVDQAVVDQRRRHVGRALGHAPLLERAAGLDRAGRARLEADDQAALAPSAPRSVGVGHGRGDDAQGGLYFGPWD